MSYIGIHITDSKFEIITGKRVKIIEESSKEWSVAVPLSRNILLLKELKRLSK